MPVGAPRVADAVGTPKQKKQREYMRNYNQAIKSKITTLTSDIKACETDLAKMKKSKTKLKQMAKTKLDKTLVNKEFDPDDFAKMGIAYVKKLK